MKWRIKLGRLLYSLENKKLKRLELRQILRYDSTTKATTSHAIIYAVYIYIIYIMCI